MIVNLSRVHHWRLLEAIESLRGEVHTPREMRTVKFGRYQRLVVRRTPTRRCCCLDPTILLSGY